MNLALNLYEPVYSVGLPCLATFILLLFFFLYWLSITISHENVRYFHIQSSLAYVTSPFMPSQIGSFSEGLPTLGSMIPTACHCPVFTPVTATSDIAFIGVFVASVAT